ncbi:MAG: lysylphosphatidylglycerol synthase transmembrane domain-containing protein [bacterium]|nr:lysylphosphatidylglycerol synthase transmembrane domain-containing protein [bacterium]
MDLESPILSPLEAGKPTGGRLLKFFRQASGYILAAACLIWVFHDTDADQLFRQIKDLKWVWLVIAIPVDLLAYVFQAVRWKLLLRPHGKIKIVKVIQAIYTGLFLNEILPMRPGELARGYLVSRWMGINFVSVLPSMTVERLFDAAWLLLGIGLTTAFVKLPRDIADSADILGIIVILALIAFAAIVLRSGKPRSPESKSKIPGGRLSKFSNLILKPVALGVREIGKTRYSYLALLISAFPTICQIIAFWFVMRAFGLDLSIWIAAATLLIVILGTAIPNAPSNVGAYQFFTVIGLTLFGVDKTTATGFSLVVFVVLSIPFWLIGLLIVNRTGIKFADFKSEISRLLKRKSEEKCTTP